MVDIKNSSMSTEEQQAEERVNKHIERMKELGIFYIEGVDPYETKSCGSDKDSQDFKHVLIHRGSYSAEIPQGCYKIVEYKTKREPVLKRGLYRIKKWLKL